MSMIDATKEHLTKIANDCCSGDSELRKMILEVMKKPEEFSNTFVEDEDSEKRLRVLRAMCWRLSKRFQDLTTMPLA